MAKVSVVLDQNYLPLLLELLSEARHSVDVVAYSFAMGSAAGKPNMKGAPYRVVQKLSELAQDKKFKVRLYLEGFRDTSERNLQTAKFLKAVGVKVRYGATHVKGFCVDGHNVLFGSTNLTNQSLMKNREANLLIQDSALSDGFNCYFEHLWEGGEHGGVNLDHPWLADGAFKDVLIDMINRSQKSIDFSIYFFNHREIEEALIRASKRGVKVKGLLHQHCSFALSYIYANRATVKRLKSKGVEDLHWGSSRFFSHSKYLVMDEREILLGTANWLQEDVLIHPQLCFHTAGVLLAKKLIRHMNEHIEAGAHMPPLLLGRSPRHFA